MFGESPSRIAGMQWLDGAGCAKAVIHRNALTVAGAAPELRESSSTKSWTHATRTGFPFHSRM